MALSAHPQEREVTSSSIPVGGPIHNSQADQWYSIQDPTEPEVKDDGGTSGPSGVLPGNRPGRAVLRREQWERLASNDSDNRPTRGGGSWNAAGARGRVCGRLACRRCRSTGHLREYIPFEKKMIDNWCRLLGTNSLKEGAVWHARLFTTVAKQRS
jgi:hypothetical protein